MEGLKPLKGWRWFPEPLVGALSFCVDDRGDLDLTLEVPPEEIEELKRLDLCWDDMLYREVGGIAVIAWVLVFSTADDRLYLAVDHYNVGDENSQKMLKLLQDRSEVKIKLESKPPFRFWGTYNRRSRLGLATGSTRPSISTGATLGPSLNSGQPKDHITMTDT